MVEPWQRVRLRGINLLKRKRRLIVALIQTHLRNEEMVISRARQVRSRPYTGPRLPVSRPATYLDMLERVLDKGIMVDSWQHIHGFGIDMLKVEARFVVASIQTHLLYEGGSKILDLSPKALKAKAASSIM